MLSKHLGQVMVDLAYTLADYTVCLKGFQSIYAKISMARSTVGAMGACVFSLSFTPFLLKNSFSIFLLFFSFSILSLFYIYVQRLWPEP